MKNEKQIDFCDICGKPAVVQEIFGPDITTNYCEECAQYQQITIGDHKNDYRNEQ